MTEPITEASTNEDQLVEIDHIVQKWLEDRREADALRAQHDDELAAFSAEFSTLCETLVRPSMEAVIQRLRANGGGGVVTERPADASRKFAHRLTLWMSLSGEIVGTPRPDRNPYLQLDADVNTETVEVWEGDMWMGHGSSRQVTRWKLSEITEAVLIKEALEILRRSVAVAGGSPALNGEQVS
jgi:hypothetical protein